MSLDKSVTYVFGLYPLGPHNKSLQPTWLSGANWSEIGLPGCREKLGALPEPPGR